MTNAARVLLGMCALLLMLPGCERETFSLPPAQGVASELVESWDGRDFKSMSALLDDRSRSRWTASRLERVMRRALRSGWIKRYDVELAETVDEPGISSEEELRRASEVTAEAPYVITYQSRAAAKPVVFPGLLDLVYDKRAEEWRARWAKSALWPQTPRASGFAVDVRWPERAAIKDRSGRLLARGGGLDRSYPQGAVAGSTLGHIGKLSDRDLDGLPHYHRTGDLVGASGLEAAYESRLAGTPTTRLSLSDAKDRVLQTLGRKKGRPGRSVKTTLDVDVQRAAESAYGGTVGGAVVVEPDSGNLLAVVSSSSFDPNNYVGATEVDPFNRALSGLYPPGSSMKVVTASAALEAGTVSPQTTITGPKDYKGVVNFESGEFGSIPFSDAVRFSVNTAFAQVAEDLGAAKLTRYADSFGFNLKPRLGVSAARSSFPRPEELWDLMWGSIGQAQVLATPLQMSTVAATIANNGKRMAPRVSFLLPKEGERVVSRRTAAQMNEMMQGVVISGTGVRAQVPGVAVAGKTGTAEVDVAGVRQNHAWFVAFAPASDPQVAIGLVSEYGGVGGQVAAPLAGRMLEAVLPLVP
ncbi:MAG: penicillin-binding protein 2 [Actinomycetota bacterium]|nr:penicillin-binding protein 2 [Actinomycetota bacterium]